MRSRTMSLEGSDAKMARIIQAPKRAQGRTIPDLRPGLFLAGIMGLLAVGFGLGWLARRPDPAPDAATSSAASVELRLDAEKLTLMPDGGLELPPLRRIEVDDLLAPDPPPAPSQTVVTEPPRGATNTPPSGL
jgi:hypothetical protein